MVIIISISLVAIIITLNNGMTFIQKTRERTIAINLAREWVEAMYQIRDTNRHRRAWQKEECRLKIDPLNDDDGNCSNDTWMGSGYYILTNAIASWQQYFILSGETTNWLDLSDGANTWDLQFSMCEWTENLWAACPGIEPVSKEGKFFRQIQWIGLFFKDESTTWWEEVVCYSGSTAGCGNMRAKEYRFCSQVAYIGKGKGHVELCSVLTNFQKK